MPNFSSEAATFRQIGDLWTGSTTFILCIGTLNLQLVESLISLLRSHWNHEPEIRKPLEFKPGVFTSSRFNESRLSLPTVHWDLEPLVVVVRTKCADKSDALQTLRASRVSPPRVGVWSACVFSAAFPNHGSMAGQVQKQELK